MGFIEGLGRSFDLALAVAPVDLSAGGQTGKRQSLKACDGVTVVVFKDKGGASVTDPQLTIKTYDASSAGNADTTTVTVDHYYKKSGTSYDGTQTWTKVAITATATPTLSSEGSSGGVYAFEINSSAAADGYTWLEVDTADAGTVAQIGGVLYIPHDLEVKRTPANLGSQLS